MKRWEERKKKKEPARRQRERETGGSWRNIQEGGMEEECVGGERKEEGAEIGIHFSACLSYAHGIRILCSCIFSPSLLQLIPFLSVGRKQKGRKKRKSYCVLCLSPLSFLFLVSFLK